MAAIKTIIKFVPANNGIAQFFVLFVIAFVMHALALKFAFPGYYDPLWPIHSDFYLPAEIANSETNIFSYLSWPRPTGMIFFALIGKLGIKGSIAAIILLTILNTTLTALLIRKITSLGFNIKFIGLFIIYAFFLFTHPFFYSFYSHDAFSQLSYLLLILGLFSFIFLYKNHLTLSALLLTTLSLIGFLAKETFGASALVIAAIWFISQRRESFWRASIPFISVFTSLAISFGFNFLINSTFVTNNNSTYSVDLRPTSVITEWIHYVSLGYNAATLCLFALIGLVIYLKPSHTSTKTLLIYTTCILAFSAALVPNSLLPSHRHVGYSWTGAYMLFACVFLLGIPYSLSKFTRTISISIIAAFVIFISLNQVLNHKKHNGSDNQWLVFQENTQRNMLTALQTLMHELIPNQTERVLVTGINFPFSPFHFPRSLTPFLNSEKTTFDIVNYAPNFQEVSRSEKVKDTPLSSIELANYTKIWMFGSDGRLIKAIDIKRFENNTSTLESLKKWVLFPEAAAALNLDFTSVPNEPVDADGDSLLLIGRAFSSYQQSNVALEYFKASTMATPENPYTWFMAGTELESQNELEAAKEFFLQAVKLDPNNENSAFNEALSRINNRLGE